MRITKRLYISRIVPAMVLVAYAAQCLPQFLMVYGAAVVHEMAHMTACAALGERVRRVSLMPYGIAMKTAVIADPVRQMAISCAGPLMSLALALVSMSVHRYFPCGSLPFFAMANMAVFSLNLCPALPLDGGILVRSLLSCRMGYVRPHRIMMAVTRVVAAFFVLLGVVFLVVSKFNISLLVIGAFLVYNLKDEGRALVHLNRLALSGAVKHNGLCVQMRHIGVDSGADARCVIRHFGYRYVCIIGVFDKRMNKLGELTEQQLLDGVVTHGTGVTAGELLSFTKTA